MLGRCVHARNCGIFPARNCEPCHPLGQIAFFWKRRRKSHASAAVPTKGTKRQNFVPTMLRIVCCVQCVCALLCVCGAVCSLCVCVICCVCVLCFVCCVYVLCCMCCALCVLFFSATRPMVATLIHLLAAWPSATAQTCHSPLSPPSVHHDEEAPQLRHILLPTAPQLRHTSCCCDK